MSLRVAANSLLVWDKNPLPLSLVSGVEDSTLAHSVKEWALFTTMTSAEH